MTTKMSSTWFTEQQTVVTVTAASCHMQRVQICNCVQSLCTSWMASSRAVSRSPSPVPATASEPSVIRCSRLSDPVAVSTVSSLSLMPAGAVFPDLHTCVQQPAACNVDLPIFTWLSCDHSPPSPGHWCEPP